MATASELLLEQEEPHFIISEDLRTVTIPYGQNVIGVFSDENVRRIWFDMPDTCDGTDLSDFQISINYINALKESGRYYVTDSTVADGTITFSWLVSRAVCASEGKVQFVVCLRLFDTDNETILKEFNTTITTMNVLVGIEAELELTDPQQDAVNSVIGPAIVATNDATAAALHAESAADGADDATAVARATANAVQAEATEAVADVAEAVARIDAKLAEVDEALDAMGDISELAVPLMSANVRGGAKLGNGLRVDDDTLSVDNLVHSGSGAEVVTDGCAIYSVDGEGWSEQRTTTGKNLLPPLNLVSQSGITMTRNLDGSIRIQGTATATVGSQDIVVQLTQGTYTLSKDASLVATYTGIQIDGGAAVCDGTSLLLNIEEDRNVSFRIRIASGTTINQTWYPQLEAGSTATAYEPYTGGKASPSPDYPQEIEVCRGRNLLDEGTAEQNARINQDGTVSTNVSGYQTSALHAAKSSQQYVFSVANSTSVMTYISWYALDGTHIQRVNVNSTSSVAVAVTSPSNAVFMRVSWDSAITWAQLELGSTPTPYVPYGHVGLEVRNATTQALVDIRAIPLPLKSDGEHWAGALPDGTADALTIDSAGRWEWKSESDEMVFDGTENWSYNANSNFAFTAKPNDGGDFGSGSSSAGKFLLDRFLVAGSGAAGTAYASGTNILFLCGGAYSPTSSAEAKAWATANPITLLYHLATPTTEHGYIDLPELPEGATVSIPELSEIGCSWFIAGVDELAQHAANWGKRALETESRIAALEVAVAELATSTS